MGIIAHGGVNGKRAEWGLRGRVETFAWYGRIRG